MTYQIRLTKREAPGQTPVAGIVQQARAAQAQSRLRMLSVWRAGMGPSGSASHVLRLRPADGRDRVGLGTVGRAQWADVAGECMIERVKRPPNPAKAGETQAKRSSAGRCRALPKSQKQSSRFEPAEGQGGSRPIDAGHQATFQRPGRRSGA
jgi:hypothetical protein